MKALSPDEKALLSEELGKIGPEGVDWQSVVRREFEGLARSGFPVPAALQELYGRTLQDAGQLPRLQQAIAGTKESVATLIPSPQSVLKAKRELDDRLRQSRLMLRK
jgi:hypothetical protein